MKKTLFFTLDFPPQRGGVSHYYQKICENLPSNKIVVLTLPHAQAEKVSCKVYRKSLIASRFVWPKWIKGFGPFLEVLRQEKIKNVLVGEVLPLGIMVWLASFFFNYRYGVFFHGLDLLNTQKKLRKKIITKAILKKASFIVVNSLYTKRKLKEFFPKVTAGKKIIVLYPCPFFLPPALEKIKKGIVQSYNLKEKKVVLSVGRLVERKGFHLIIDLWPEIKKKHPEAFYVLLGSNGGYKEEILKKIKKINKDILFIENAPQEEVKAWLDLAYLFVMPSFQIGEDVEGFGIVYLEAGAFSKPVIGGKDGGVPEAIVHKKTGLVVDSLNKKELLKAILFLLDNEKTASLWGRTGKERVEKEFSWAGQVEKLKKIL